MFASARATIALATLTACGGGGGGAADPPPPTTALTVDAGATPPPPAPGITTTPRYDPRDGFHLDPDPVSPTAQGGASRRARPVVSLLLRSTPVGAIAAVDGQNLGPTPVLWEGESGRAHDFTFRLPGHALARYKFVPITSGVVHGTLVRVTYEAAEATPAGATSAAPAAGARPAEPVQPAAPVPVDAAPVPVDAAPEVDAPPPIDAEPAPPPIGPTP